MWVLIPLEFFFLRNCFTSNAVFLFYIHLRSAIYSWLLYYNLKSVKMLLQDHYLLTH